ncbi:unnamed protein product [Macrosiphum euphorbiae]|uniref:Uncharacterized protein n=1 Tax=Macrosiphum euphorbiae TaxID=13131 RepID=A0AAV0VVN1_9HEMI|nr:unnamed protein product [Macrosiphum euphorbiae]
MLAKHLYGIVQSEENTVAFLKERGFIEIGTPPCVHCGSQTKFYTHKERGKERTVIRCTIAVKELNPFVKVTRFSSILIKMVNVIVVYHFHKF